MAESLSSTLPYLPHVVYVDSGSEDGSANAARANNLTVLSLDASEPYTPARARNEGMDYLRKKFPHLKYLQFLDGDCRLTEGWPEIARARLTTAEDCGVVTGYRREKDRNISVYTRLLDVEWRRIWEPQQGLVENTGGDMFARIEALDSVGGFRKELYGGEEPELCVRMKAAGWKICKIHTEMSVHDGSNASLLGRISRHARFGWAVSEIRGLYGGTRVGLYRENDKRIWRFGIFIPAVGFTLALHSPALAISALCIRFA